MFSGSFSFHFVSLFGFDCCLLIVLLCFVFLQDKINSTFSFCLFVCFFVCFFVLFLSFLILLFLFIYLLIHSLVRLIVCLAVFVCLFTGLLVCFSNTKWYCESKNVVNDITTFLVKKSYRFHFEQLFSPVIH